MLNERRCETEPNKMLSLSIDLVLKAAPLVRVRIKFTGEPPNDVAEETGTAHTVFLTVIFTLACTSGAALRNIRADADLQNYGIVGPSFVRWSRRA